MRLARRLILFTGLLVMTAVVSPRPASGQLPGRASDGQIPLSTAIEAFSKQSGVSVVFADRLVSGLTTSCIPTGIDKRSDLECILDGSGLTAQWTRNDQAVLSRDQVPAEATGISGLIRDSESGEPIPGVHVLVSDRPFGVVSSIEGEFRLDEVKRHETALVFSHLGYETREIRLNNENAVIEVSLDPHTIEATTLLVEEDRSTTDDLLSGQGGSYGQGVAPYDFVTAFGELGLGAAVSPVVSRTGEVSGQFVVRGGLPDQNLFKLEGAPVYQPWHSQGLFSVLQPSTVAGMKLFAGPLPSDQGGYLASVLDAELKSGGSSLSGYAGVSSTVGELSFSGPVADGVTAMVAGRHSHPGLNRTHSLSLPNNQQLDAGSFHDLAAKVAVKSAPNNYFSFTGYHGRDYLDWRVTGDDLGEARNDQWSNGVVSFKHRYLASDRLMVSNTFFVSTFDGVSWTAASDILDLSDGDSQHARDAGMKIDVDFRAASDHTVKTGIEFSQHHLEWSDRLGADYFRDDVMEGALFAHDTWSLTERLYVRPGLRLSWFGNGVGWRPEPRFHAMYSVSPSTSLHASWSRQVQYIHQVNDVVSGGLGSTLQRWMVSADSNTPPSEGQQANIGVSALAGPAWTLSADFYWRDFDNVFLPRNQFTTDLPLHVLAYNATSGFGDFEQGSTMAYGVELTAAYRKRWFMFSSSYTGSRSAFHVPSQLTQSYRPGVYDTPHVVRSSTGFVGDRFSLVVTAEARTGYPTMASIRGTAHKIGGDRLPTYFRLDAALGYRFSKLGLDWNLVARVYNLTDRDNIVGYEYDRDLLYLRRTSLLGVSRWPTFSLQVNW